MDHFTETTRMSYGVNIGNSFKGILLGLILLIGSIVFLWWNEGRSVNQADALNEMNDKIVTLLDSIYHPEYENKVVLVQGEVKPISQIADTLFGVKSDDLVLHRKVEMYQWNENRSSQKEEKLGGDTEAVTTYRYVKEWSSEAVISESFQHPEGHHNPAMPYESQTFVADANLGDYYLSKNIVGIISASQMYNGLSSMPEQLHGARNYKSFLYVSTNIILNNVNNTNMGISSPQNPRIGDMKITYTYAPAGIYSVAAKSQNKALVHYTTRNNKSFAFVRGGIVSAQHIFQELLDANSTLTWIIRVFGLLLMFIGFTLIMGLLVKLAKVIPMLGSLVGSVTSVVAGILTLILGSIIISLAWFTSRPMLSLVIITIGVVVAVGLAKLGMKKKVFTSTSERVGIDTVEENKQD